MGIKPDCQLLELSGLSILKRLFATVTLSIVRIFIKHLNICIIQELISKNSHDYLLFRYYLSFIGYDDSKVAGILIIAIARCPVVVYITDEGISFYQ